MSILHSNNNQWFAFRLDIVQNPSFYSIQPIYFVGIDSSYTSLALSSLALCRNKSVLVGFFLFVMCSLFFCMMICFGM